MQAQSSASAMLWLHTVYTGATPGILTPLPKPAKGMREKLGKAWEKKGATFGIIIRNSRNYLYMQQINQNHSGGPW